MPAESPAPGNCANWQNRTLFHGDNLRFLRAMNSGSVDLIATDPPFNRGKDFHATPDSLAAGARFQDRWSWEKDVHQDRVDQLKDDYPKLMEAIESARYAHSDGMGAYLCFMAVRLLEMRRVLKSTGTIYLHCDPTASHYLKAAMDAIFGYRQFRNEIVWCYAGGGIPKRDFPRKHDIILRYSKTGTCRYRPIYRSCTEGTRHRDRTAVKGKRFEVELDPKGMPENDWWVGVKKITSPTDPEKVGYPTQKSLKLYERFIQVSSDVGDIILDPFAGCATTLVAAERLGRQGVGIDIRENSKEVILQRLAKESLTEKEEISRSGHIFPEEIVFTDQLPERTDDQEEAAPFLQVKVRVKEPEGPCWSRRQMYDHLLEQHGCKCQRCDREFDDPRYLQLDHNTPRSDGGINHISNRVLLCGPCNQLKSNIYALSGLHRENKRRGYMAPGKDTLFP